MYQRWDEGTGCDAALPSGRSELSARLYSSAVERASGGRQLQRESLCSSPCSFSSLPQLFLLLVDVKGFSVCRFQRQLLLCLD